MRPDKRRERWMGEFEQAVTQARPDHAGKINWDSATYHFNKGAPPADAAEKYVTSLEGSP